MRTQVILDAWREPDELPLLKSYFYGSHSRETAELRRRACHIVGAWESKGRIPHAVAATAELTQALLDEENEAIPVTTRLNAFCMAWIRFVNGITDSQQLFRSKQSMFQIARQLDMPASFIELRHRIIHEHKPTMRELHRAGNDGLTWLFSWYWEHLDESGINASDFSVDEAPSLIAE